MGLIHNSPIFKNNLEALRQHHPHVVPSLNTPPPFEMEVREGPSGLPNLYFRETTGGEQSLYLESDPLAGMTDILDGIKGVWGRIVCFLGFGLGIQATQIVITAADVNVVVLFEAHPAIFRAAMENKDLVAVLSHPNVRLVVGQTVDLHSLLSSELDKLFGLAEGQIVRFERAVALSPRWYKKAEKQFLEYNRELTVAKNTVGKAGRALFENRFNNLIAMAVAKPIEALNGQLGNMPAIIVAAGPSLSKNIQHLDSIKHRAVIIAVDSAVGPLSHRGIVPHFVASIDYGGDTYEKLEPFKDLLKHTGLIFSAESTFKVPNYLLYKNLFYTFVNKECRDYFNRILNTRIEQPLGNCQSVLHLAMDFAKHAGCNPIILTGVDLAYHEGHDHAEGVVLNWGNQQLDGEGVPYVEDVYGNLVPTNDSFLGMLHTCEKMIESSPGTTYIDATEGGARIKGTNILALAEAIRTYCKIKLNFPKLPDIKPVDCPTSEILYALKECLREVHRCKKLIKEFIKHADHVDQFLSKLAPPIEGSFSFTEDIKHRLQKIEILLNKLNQEKVFEIIADIVTGPYLDQCRIHRAKVLKAEASKKISNIFISQYDQHIFVQTIRKEALTFLEHLLANQLRVCSSVEKLLGDVATKSESQDTLLNLAAFYIDEGYLGLAAQFLGKIRTHDARRILLSGALTLKQGNITEGLQLMQKALKIDSSYLTEMNKYIFSVEDELLQSFNNSGFRGFSIRRLNELGRSKEVVDDRWLENAATMEQMLSTPSVTPETLWNVDSLLSYWAPVKNELPQWWVIKARLFNLKDLPGEALDSMETAINMTTEDNPEWMAMQARFLIESGRSEEGIAKLQEAVKIDSKTAVLWDEIGDALVANSDLDGAIAAYENCLSALPDRMDVLKKIGDCHVASGNMEAAKAAYEKVLARRG